ncbi:MAG TPA: hypothetical protein VG101_21020 [Puia sp.]|jgi:hypothetical protein|nr:hypothetical protein [Puia sp.]
MDTQPEVISQENDTSKGTRFRSVAYPSHDIKFCVDLTTKINKVFGNLTFTKRESISKELGIGDSSLQTQLSTCVQYGLLDIKLNFGYKPSSQFTKIYKPLPTEDPKTALIECFQRPALYKALIKQYNGADLPMQAGLATVLYRNHKVSEQASEQAAKIFIQNAKALGLLKDSGLFKVPTAGEVEVIEVEEIPPEKDTPPATKPILLNPPGQLDKNPNPTEVKIPVLLDDGGIAQIVLPNGIKRIDLERIGKVIAAYIQ